MEKHVFLATLLILAFIAVTPSMACADTMPVPPGWNNLPDGWGIIVDDGNDGFQCKQNAWSYYDQEGWAKPSPLDGSETYPADHHYVDADGWVDGNGNAKEAWAKYTPPIEIDGYYKVYAYIPSNEWKDHPSSVLYKVKDAKGTVHTVYIDQTKEYTWQYLGEYLFTDGKPVEYVQVFNKNANGKIRNANTVADAVAFVRQPDKKMSLLVENSWNNLDGTYSALFGYNNPNEYTVHIDLGSNNKLSGTVLAGEPITSFEPGRHEAFEVTWGTVGGPVCVENRGNIVWSCNGKTTTAACADIVIDNLDGTECTVNGKWNPSTKSTDRWGSNYLAAKVGSSYPGVDVVYKPNMFKGQNYRIYSYYCASETLYEYVPYAIVAKDSEYLTYVDQTEKADAIEGWSKVVDGTFIFQQWGKGGYVDLSTESTGDWVVADAIWFMSVKDPEPVELRGLPLPDPVVDFSMCRSSEAPLEVQFTDESENLPEGQLDYLWDFGDGRDSTSHNPLVIYAEPGIYSVTLTIKLGDEVIGSVEKDCAIKAVDFIYNVEDKVKVSFEPLCIGFTEELTYGWAFGDGTSSPEECPVHSYEDGGTYTVIMTVYVNGDCYDQVSKDIELEKINSGSSYMWRPYPPLDDGDYEVLPHLYAGFTFVTVEVDTAAPMNDIMATFMSGGDLVFGGSIKDKLCERPITISDAVIRHKATWGATASSLSIYPTGQFRLQAYKKYDDGKPLDIKIWGGNGAYGKSYLLWEGTSADQLTDLRFDCDGPFSLNERTAWLKSL